MKSKLEYFKNNFIKDKDNIHVLDKEDSYVENFGKQWRDYKYVQIDSFNNFTISYDYLREIFFNKLSNIKNKTITLVKNNESLLKILKSLQPRKDNLKPKLRNSLLNKSLSETTYRKKLDNIISSIL